MIKISPLFWRAIPPASRGLEGTTNLFYIKNEFITFETLSFQAE